MQIIDIFNNDAFSVVHMGAAINVVPNQFGRIGALNVFPDVGVATTAVAIEENIGVLNLIPSSRRGAPGTAGVRGKGRIRSLNTAHFSIESQLTADDLRNKRGPDGQVSLASAQDMINKALIEHRQKQDITREHLRAGALRGAIIDADGSTILDLFTEFGVAEKVVDFVLGTAGTDVRLKSLEVARHMELSLQGDVSTGVRALCSKTFFEKLISHASVTRAWDNWQGSSDKLGNDPRRGFFFGGVTYEEYVGSATVLNEDGTTTVRAFIPEGDARFYPEGTRSTFFTYNAPSTFLENVGQDGTPFYSKVAPDPKLNRFVDIYSEQNPLPVCLRPALLVRGFSSN